MCTRESVFVIIVVVIDRVPVAAHRILEICHKRAYVSDGVHHNRWYTTRQKVMQSSLSSQYVMRCLLYIYEKKNNDNNNSFTAHNIQIIIPRSGPTRETRVYKWTWNYHAEPRWNRFRDRTVYYTFAVQDSAELTSFFFYEQTLTTCLHDKILALKNGQWLIGVILRSCDRRKYCNFVFIFSQNRPYDSIRNVIL